MIRLPAMICLAAGMALEEYSKHDGFMHKTMIGAMRPNAVKALGLFQ